MLFLGRHYLVDERFNYNAAEAIKKDMEELTKIVIENKISKVRIHDVFFQIKDSFVNPWSS